MKHYILLLVILLIGININQGNEYQLYNIEKCYGDAELKIRGKLNSTIDYAIKDCNYNNGKWICKCKDYNTPIILQTRDTTVNSYYIILQYQIKPLRNDEIENENNKRVINLNDIYVGYFPEEIYKKPFEFNILAIIVVLIVVTILIGGLVFLFVYLYKIFKLDDEDVITDKEYKKLQDKWRLKNEQELTDEDYNNSINKYRKV